MDMVLATTYHVFLSQDCVAVEKNKLENKQHWDDSVCNTNNLLSPEEIDVDQLWALIVIPILKTVQCYYNSNFDRSLQYLMQNQTIPLIVVEVLVQLDCSH